MVKLYFENLKPTLRNNPNKWRNPCFFYLIEIPFHYSVIIKIFVKDRIKNTSYGINIILYDYTRIRVMYAQGPAEKWHDFKTSL